MAKKMYLVDDRNKALTVFEILVQIVVVAVLALFIAKYFFYSAETESKSMEPTIEPSSVVFVNRTSYLFNGPKRFDVVAFDRGESGRNDDVLVRRIVGLPGETVRITRGTVYINDVKLNIDGIISEITSDGIAASAIRLDDDEYFVLGDTPANSEDSRSSTIGAVNVSQIVGRAWLSAKSLTEITFIR